MPTFTYDIWAVFINFPITKQMKKSIFIFFAFYTLNSFGDTHEFGGKEFISVEVVEVSESCIILRCVDKEGAILYNVIAAVATTFLPEVVNGICKRTIGDPDVCNAVYDVTTTLVSLRGVKIYQGMTKSLKWIANRGLHNSKAEVSTVSYQIAQGVKTVFEEYKKECSSGRGIPWGQISMDSESKNYLLMGKYPQGSTRLIECSELLGKSKWELSIMRNEIFARNGYNFHLNPKVKAYFESQQWYNEIPKVSFDSEYIYKYYLTEIEKKNILLIQQYEK